VCVVIVEWLVFVVVTYVRHYCSCVLSHSFAHSLTRSGGAIAFPFVIVIILLLIRVNISLCLCATSYVFISHLSLSLSVSQYVLLARTFIPAR